ncbi:hypothetical protein ATERTT37_006339 [Aspergillus terreus]
MPTETIPGTNRPAVFKLPDPGSLGLDQEPPIASGRLVYNTDDASTLERFKIRELSEGWPMHRDADVRFVLFLGKQPQGWQIFCNHPIYEKDKIVPVNPSRIPKIDPEAVAKEPKGYRYLAYSIRRLGYPIKTNLPQLYGRERDLVYQEMVDWLDGKEIDFSADEF